MHGRCYQQEIKPPNKKSYLGKIQTQTLSGALESGVPLPNDVGNKRSSDQPQTLHTFLWHTVGHKKHFQTKVLGNGRVRVSTCLCESSRSTTSVTRQVLSGNMAAARNEGRRLSHRQLTTSWPSSCRASITPELQMQSNPMWKSVFVHRISYVTRFWV